MIKLMFQDSSLVQVSTYGSQVDISFQGYFLTLYFKTTNHEHWLVVEGSKFILSSRDGNHDVTTTSFDLASNLQMEFFGGTITSQENNGYLEVTVAFNNQ